MLRTESENSLVWNI